MSYIRKIDLCNDNKRTRNKKNSLVCPSCIETNDYFNLFSKKINQIEEIVDKLRKNSNLPSKKADQFSIFNAKFTLNNVPCELEYNLSKFSLEDLQKLVIVTTPNCNNKYPSSNTSNESDSSEYSNNESP
ncbi:hypothetical protein RhiirA5_355489 [Rhizophagus irregularis]|uniref:Uncharacterized protein n=4 Tax=Rhizophagus irregularis TaxID=588596 RepID=A0A2I1EY35_9GLOM|nr:hypothetical protein GLOIN_2v1769442 [Rhizophagus irregularis DAOM 181602=DAOM 197198]EXX50380.1 hypothetical protein RirG_271450 [Rhizophagus irregularis DAOM 197198w]PKC10441.1 hypothetical protein RhiirA5_355489 [Rhizophagus irregularis]PKC65320.1 hypothetical protein RhiirA1_420567 [Rhizophagus irregularis]PKY27034.1 hypothetical protein RhiirB3_415721 [Rhizophagus irregularis]POG76013.1 hypothetical protein GLOIN_2v1769442 [Rhizophagus irregularis DAOM 181602=DAOM 197198]|eukprot:XP_025182879.1 hypothetical protein GLOIN_2v1769442 [Rhizophagus irregularis DAOM 181602=DAOM 197198]